jgi:hypothetical protein
LGPMIWVWGSCAVVLRAGEFERPPFRSSSGLSGSGPSGAEFVRLVYWGSWLRHLGPSWMRWGRAAYSPLLVLSLCGGLQCSCWYRLCAAQSLHSQACPLSVFGAPSFRGLLGNSARCWAFRFRSLGMFCTLAFDARRLVLVPVLVLGRDVRAGLTGLLLGGCRRYQVRRIPSSSSSALSNSGRLVLVLLAHWGPKSCGFRSRGLSADSGPSFCLQCTRFPSSGARRGWDGGMFGLSAISSSVLWIW